MRKMGTRSACPEPSLTLPGVVVRCRTWPCWRSRTMPNVGLQEGRGHGRARGSCQPSEPIRPRCESTISSEGQRRWTRRTRPSVAGGVRNDARAERYRSCRRRADHRRGSPDGSRGGTDDRRRGTDHCRCRGCAHACRRRGRGHDQRHRLELRLERRGVQERDGQINDKFKQTQAERHRQLRAARPGRHLDQRPDVAHRRPDGRRHGHLRLRAAGHHQLPARQPVHRPDRPDSLKNFDQTNVKPAS